MKKRIFCLLLAVMLCVSMLPIGASAAEILVKSVDLTMEVPTDGMSLEAGRKMTLTAGQSAYGDLVASGDLTLTNVSWEGDFVDGADGKPAFQGGKSYIATLRLMFNWNGSYRAPYDKATYCTGPKLFQVTVNGVQAQVFESSMTNPVVQVVIAIPGKQLSAEEQQAQEAARSDKWDSYHDVMRSFEEPYTTAEADALWVGEQEMDVVVLDAARKPKEGYSYGLIFNKQYTPQETLYITKVIADFADADFQNDYQKELFGEYMSFALPNLKELWVSDKFDVKALLQGMDRGIGKQPPPNDIIYYWENSKSFCTAASTLFVPASKVNEIKAANIHLPFTIKIYDGDVYTAQKKGASAAREWCTNHDFSYEIMAADRIQHYETCQTDRRWYYSCSSCGKCEYNDKHTFSKGYGDNNPVGPSIHRMYARLATEEAYVGVNAAGEHVYWMSCIYCGHSQNYFDEQVTQEEWKLAGMTELSFAQYQEMRRNQVALSERNALISDQEQPDMFLMNARANAKMSTWARDPVNQAADNYLLDAALLGNDYTKSISRLQFCSVAVRLAEELTGKTITPAAASTFSDTSNPYVLKAYAAGITTGTSPTTFTPGGTLTRQEMAAFLYRTLQYVKANSDIGYSAYTSRLANYADRNKIAVWATEPMAFMNALDLIQGTSPTMLSPGGSCTIEQALTVASRSLYAHQIGWYQVVVGAREKEFGRSGGRYHYGAHAYSGLTPMSLAAGDRIWITGNRMGDCFGWAWLHEAKGQYEYYNSFWPTIDPHSDQTFYVMAEGLIPIRD